MLPWILLLSKLAVNENLGTTVMVALCGYLLEVLKRSAHVK